MRETDLYPPVKQFLEGQGYVVKAEIRDCDVVAMRGDEAPVIVELKTAFSLRLVLQAIDRQAMTDAVYIAIAPPKRRDYWDIVKLCRRLGLGLLVVAGDRLEALADPAPYKPRRMAGRVGLLLKEFAHRAGDPNSGGMRGRRMTGYRQDALRLVGQLAGTTGMKTADLRKATGVQRAAGMLQRDVYGWFRRVGRGVYALSPGGDTAAAEFAAAIAGLAAIPPPAAPASAPSSATPVRGRRASRRGGGAARDTAPP